MDFITALVIAFVLVIVGAVAIIAIRGDEDVRFCLFVLFVMFVAVACLGAFALLIQWTYNSIGGP